MNNKLYHINNNHNFFQLIEHIEFVNVDLQHTSVNLKIFNGMTFSLNWSTGKFNYSRYA